MTKAIRQLSLVCFALLLTGCAVSPRTEPDTGSGILSQDSTPTPGIVRLDADRQQVKAVGTLVYERKNNRFSLINAGPDKALTGKEPVIATITEDKASGATDADLVALVGAYVELRGTAQESTEGAFPKVEIESMRILSLPERR